LTSHLRKLRQKIDLFSIIFLPLESLIGLISHRAAPLLNTDIALSDIALSSIYAIESRGVDNRIH
jgi:hypothetical protein